MKLLLLLAALAPVGVIAGIISSYPAATSLHTNDTFLFEWPSNAYYSIQAQYLLGAIPAGQTTTSNNFVGTFTGGITVSNQTIWPSNTFSLSAATNGVPNFGFVTVNSNAAALTTFWLSNGQAYVYWTSNGVPFLNPTP